MCAFAGCEVIKFWTVKTTPEQAVKGERGLAQESSLPDVSSSIISGCDMLELSNEARLLLSTRAGTGVA